MTEYVAGFMFDQERRFVALVVKNKPKWQEGRMNGIGGKVEPDESPLHAMVREFREEAGLTHNAWKHFCVISGVDWRVFFFFCVTNHVFDVRSMTEEAIRIVRVEEVAGPDFMTNLPWLVRMALSMEDERADMFVIQEVAKH